MPRTFFLDFIICKIKNSAMFLISQAFLALATRRRCGAGLPGGSGGRAARDSTYGQPRARSQRSFDFHAFWFAVWICLFKTYENQHILHVFPCPKRPHVWAPAGALPADLWFACFLRVWIRKNTQITTYSEHRRGKPVWLKGPGAADGCCFWCF